MDCQQQERDKHWDKAPSLTSALWILFYNSFDCLLSSLAALGQANHYTGLRNQFSLKPRTFQRGTFKIIYEHFQYRYQIAPSSIPCYCRAKQPWNSLDSHHFNETKSQVLSMRIPPPIWVFFSCFVFRWHAERSENRDTSLTSQEEYALSWHHFPV